MEPDEGRGAAEELSPRRQDGRRPDQGGAGQMREPGIASGQRELGAMVEPRVNGPRRKSRDTPATATLEDGRPAELAP